MDDFRIWFWVIILAIWILRSIGKKKERPVPKRQKATERPQTSTQRPPQPKAVTFEELLREIQSSKEQKEAAAPKPRPVPVPARPFVDYDDDIEEEVKGEENQSLEEIEINKKRQRLEETTRVYEEAKKLAFYRPSLEETMKLEDTDTRFGHFKEYALTQAEKPYARLVSELRNPESFKRAFILSEILKPKFGR